MLSIEDRLALELTKRHGMPLAVQTLGQFAVWREKELIHPRDWGRESTIRLFQFLITSRNRRGLHKEQIIDRIWEDADNKRGDRNFKVALHGIHKILEPNRPKRADPRFIIRQGLTYQLNRDLVWVDADAMEAYIAIGNEALDLDLDMAIQAYREAIDLYEGVFLPNRLYEDWSSEERERLQIIALGAFMKLAEILIETNPMESIRLAQLALTIDHTWEDAYRIQMKAYLANGNRPLAIKTYRQCEKILDEEFGIDPLPMTKNLLQNILAIGS